MFILREMKDVVRIPPGRFAEDRLDVLLELVDGKYCNKVVPNVGLCVCVFEFTKLGDAFVYPGDGASHMHVEFLMAVFRPQVDEVLEGVVKFSSQLFMRISLGFVEDLYVEPQHLKPNTAWINTEKHWKWNFDDATGAGDQDGEDAAKDEKKGEEEGEGELYTICKGDSMRLRVHSVMFKSQHNSAAHNRMMESAKRSQIRQVNGGARSVSFDASASAGGALAVAGAIASPAAAAHAGARADAGAANGLVSSLMPTPSVSSLAASGPASTSATAVGDAGLGALGLEDAPLPAIGEGRVRSSSCSSGILMNAVEEATTLPLSKRRAPMMIMCNISAEGLGNMVWWDADMAANDDDDDDDDEEEDGEDDEAGGAGGDLMSSDEEA